ncbi:MAG: MFS transporter [Anaerolineae bacterium]|nr:MFS transporter [Anaerolineae bacterium]
MRAFTIVWFGQFISLIGTGMTQFAVALWAWQLTGQATALALVSFFTFGPMVLVSPLAGALVDRLDRKLVMMLSDLAAGLSTIILFALLLADHLEIWHLYAAGAFAGTFQAFQFPAYSAAVTTMIPKAQYGRAQAMLGLAESAARIFAPIAASALFAFIDLRGIMLIDIITFCFAILTLWFVYIPTPSRTETGAAAQGSLLQESLYGFRYILARPSLFGLQLVFLFGNWLATIAFELLPPMLLARTGGNELALGSVQSAMGIGGVVSGMVLTAWGGPRRRVNGVLIGWTISGFFMLLLGLAQVLPLWMLFGFAMLTSFPLVNASNQAIWQAKVAPDVQGRVFAIRALIAQATTPIGMLLAGPLADVVFEPAMQPGGALAGTFGPYVGTGPGAGMALIFIACGFCTALVGLSAYRFRAIREVEDILPDHDLAVEPAPV